MKPKKFWEVSLTEIKPASFPNFQWKNYDSDSKMLGVISFKNTEVGYSYEKTLRSKTRWHSRFTRCTENKPRRRGFSFVSNASAHGKSH